MENKRKSIVGIPVMNGENSSDDDSTLCLEQNFAEIIEKFGDRNRTTNLNKPNLYEGLLKTRNISPKYKLRQSIAARARREPINKKFLFSTPLTTHNNNQFGISDEDELPSPIVPFKEGGNEILATTLQNTLEDVAVEEDNEKTVQKTLKGRKRNNSKLKCDEIVVENNVNESVNRENAEKMEKTVTEKENSLNNVIKRLTALKSICSNDSYSIDLDENCAQWKGIKKIRKHRNARSDIERTIRINNDKSIQTTMNDSQTQTVNNTNVKNLKTVDDILELIDKHCLTFNQDKILEEHFMNSNDCESSGSSGSCDGDDVADNENNSTNQSNSTTCPEEKGDNDDDDGGEEEDDEELIMLNDQPWRLTGCVPPEYIALNRFVVPSILNFTKHMDATSSRRSHCFTSGSNRTNLLSTDRDDVNVSPTKREKQSYEKELSPNSRISDSKTPEKRQENIIHNRNNKSIEKKMKTPENRQKSIIHNRNDKSIEKKTKTPDNRQENITHNRNDKSIEKKTKTPENRQENIIHNRNDKSIEKKTKTPENRQENITHNRNDKSIQKKTKTPENRQENIIHNRNNKSVEKKTKTPENRQENIIHNRNDKSVENKQLTVVLSHIDNTLIHSTTNDKTNHQMSFNKSQNNVSLLTEPPPPPPPDGTIESNSLIKEIIVQKSDINKTLTPKNNRNIVSSKEMAPSVRETRSRKNIENVEMLKGNNGKNSNTKPSTSKKIETIEANTTSNVDGTGGLRRSTRERKQTVRTCIFRLPKSSKRGVLNDINEMSSTIINQKLNEIKQPLNPMLMKKLEISARTNACEYLLLGKSKVDQSTNSHDTLPSNRKPRKKSGKKEETVRDGATTSNEKDEETFKRPRGRGRKSKNPVNTSRENVEKQKIPTSNSKGRKGNRGRGKNKQVEPINDNNTQEIIQQVEEHNEINNSTHNGNEIIGNNEPELQENHAETSIGCRNDEVTNFEPQPANHCSEIHEHLEMDHVENDPIIESQLNDTEIRTLSPRKRLQPQEIHDETQKTAPKQRKTKKDNDLHESCDANPLKLHDFVLNNGGTSDTESQQQLSTSDLHNTSTSKRNQTGSVKRSGRISKKYKQNLISMEVLNNTFNDLYDSLHVKWKHSKNMHKFGTRRPHFTKVRNGKIGVTVREENGDGSMGYIVVNSHCTMDFDAENYNLFCTVIDGKGKLVVNEKSFQIDKLMDFIIQHDHDFTISNLDEEKDLVIHFVRSANCN